jgi:hypothetical protein
MQEGVSTQEVKHRYRQVLVLYLDRPRLTAGRGTLWRAMQIQRLEGSRSAGRVLCIFYLTGVIRMACVGGAAGQFGRLQRWSMQSWAVLRQPGRAAEVVL